MPGKIARTDLIAELRRLADELDAVPTREQMNELGKYSRSPYDTEFGGWNEALRAAGFEPNKPVKLSREELLDELTRLAEAIERVPRQKDMNDRGQYSVRAYNREWENWNAALRAAGFEPNKVHGAEYPTLTCEHCGEEYQVKPSLQESSRFCSDECKNAAKTKWVGENNPHPNAGKRVTKECEWCGDEFEVKLSKKDTARFCSLECLGKYNGNTWVGENHPRWNGGKVRYYGPNWHKQRRRRLEKDNYECRECGMSDEECRERFGQGLEIHHKTPIKQFENNGEIDYEAANRLDNLVSLCRVCHQKTEKRLKAGS